MKKILFLLLAFRFFTAHAGNKDSTVYYNLPDSVKAISFYTGIKVQQANGKGFFTTGIQTQSVGLYLQSRKGKGIVQFTFPPYSAVVARGSNVDVWTKGTIDFPYNWKPGETYKLMIAMAGDSAGNFSLYSGYIWLPEQQKWKLLGTCKITGQWKTMENLSAFTSKPAKNTAVVQRSEVWCQRNNGSWKMIEAGDTKPPVINLFGHADSVTQHQAEIAQIEAAITAGTNTAKNVSEGVYYEMIKEGTGGPVTINDTVTIHYKGYLFADGTVFDQTKDKPATFPLKRLIRGWQIGVPLCRVGGKIKLVIPSALAYAARTRAAKIPPNSILVFEIEVVDTKPGK
ncbi:MAG: FKBP-type peptidyl-prolyl cis-trans isomerase [Chitinophagaceae bacterium]|nr:FKBP-type peptidyl-prolyl cis-trans isomerase [Chitinophagaceae bacterium]